MKRAQFSFAWMFAIIAGGAILAFAIYGALQFADVGERKGDTVSAKQFSILLDPLQAGFSDESFGSISFAQSVTLSNVCLDGEFGEHRLSIGRDSLIQEEGISRGEAIPVTDKYIFSEEVLEGDQYFIFSQSFDFPFEVADILIVTTQKYCFIDAPDEVIRPLTSLNLPHIAFEDCEFDDPVRVCFGSSSQDCDIRVSGTCSSSCESIYDRGFVDKQGASLPFVDSLLYAAIFSDKRVYDCAVNRLLYRSASIADVLIEKTDYMNARGCSSNMKGPLILWKHDALTSTVDDLGALRPLSLTLQQQNQREICGVWE